MSVFISAFDQIKPTTFSSLQASALKPFEFVFGEMEIDANSEFYPQRSDLKIMRSDVVASIIVTNNLIKNLLQKIDLEEAGLFVASGVFIENSDAHLSHLIQVFEEYEKTSDPDERMRKLYRASPPLLALQTLTNSSMSFIAQYTGIKGNNATFGTSSHSGSYALHQAFQEAQFNQKNSFVCVTNCAGPQSFLMNLSFKDYAPDWKESSSVSTLLICPKNDEKHARCKIAEINFYSSVPNLKHKPDYLPVPLLKNLSETRQIILSGAHTSVENSQFVRHFEDKNLPVSSIFHEFGNMGPVNPLASIGKALEHFQQIKTAHRIDVIDIDVYGRIAHIILEAC